MDIQALLQHCDTLTDGQSLLQILQRATAILENHLSWCQGAKALNASKQSVRIASPGAVALSIEGAIGRVSNSAGIVPPFILKYLDALVLELVGEPGEPSVYNEHDTGWFNDSFDHESILQLLYLAQQRLVEAMP
jgi:hypothetical protein